MSGGPAPRPAVAGLLAVMLLLVFGTGCLTDSSNPATPTSQETDRSGNLSAETKTLVGDGGFLLEFVPDGDGECRFFANATGTADSPAPVFGAGFREADELGPNPDRSKATVRFEHADPMGPRAEATLAGESFGSGEVYPHWWAAKVRFFEVNEASSYEVLAAGTNLTPLPEDPDVEPDQTPPDWLEDWSGNRSLGYHLACDVPYEVEQVRTIDEIQMLNTHTMEPTAAARGQGVTAGGSLIEATVEASRTVTIDSAEVIFLGHLGNDASKLGNLTLTSPDGRTIQWTPKPCAFGTGCLGSPIVNVDSVSGAYTAKLHYAEVFQPELETFLVGLGDEVEQVKN